ncbi:MAG TPA: ACP S-malonyltransferase [Thermoanaerobaculia bacterium]|nr:ACP S-malonyltransferase [Thermoanaerobaculia bacterium]HQP89004.1 ACP S-malonyltransferase [Thermoanaerobaculia bacterium]
MRRFAALFPGQLSEKAGMGEALAASFPRVASFFEQVSERSGVDVAGTFFGEGRPDLHADLPAQVGVFAVSVAALDVLAEEHGLYPSACAGYSLGTYAAFVGAGVLDRWAALDVLLEVERLLREKAPAGTMGFVIGLPELEVAAELARLTRDPHEVAIGNVNAAQQVVLTGRREPVLRALDHLAMHALKSEALPLGWPMHSPALAPVAAELAELVSSRIRFAFPGRAALYAPMLGRVVRSEEEARLVLTSQIARTSRWADVLLAMASAGETRFVEVGPGDLLSKMHRWTLRSSRADVLEDPAGIARFASALGAPALGAPARPAAGEEVA